MDLEKLIKIQIDTKTKNVTPIVLDYYKNYNFFIDKGYEVEESEDYSLIKTKVKYMQRRINK